MLDYIFLDVVFEALVLGTGRGMVRFFGGDPDNSFLLWMLSLILGLIFWLAVGTGLFYLIIWIL